MNVSGINQKPTFKGAYVNNVNYEWHLLTNKANHYIRISENSVKNDLKQANEGKVFKIFAKGTDMGLDFEKFCVDLVLTGKKLREFMGYKTIEEKMTFLNKLFQGNIKLESNLKIVEGFLD